MKFCSSGTEAGERREVWSAGEVGYSIRRKMRTQTLLPDGRLTALRHSMTIGLGCAAAVLALLPGLLIVAGHEPAPALAALWRGSFGSGYALLSATLVRATPLILAGLAVALAFRAGVWNIGAEGQLLAGAAAGTAAALVCGDRLGPLTPVVVVAAGAVGGALLAGGAGILRARFGVLEIISTIMLNFAALHFVGFLVRGPLQEPSGLYPQSATIMSVARLPALAPPNRLHLGLVIALFAAVALWLVLRYTEVGFRLRAVGANPVAARTAGSINVVATTLGALVASGALAGIAGASEVSGVTFALYETLSPGYGYTAIAVALLARLHPIGIVFSGIFLGALQAGGAAMQRDAGVPSVLVSIVEALLILAMAVAAARSLRPSSTIPEPLDDERRPAAEPVG
jgi:simple sugar transport system permease protein